MIRRAAVANVLQALAEAAAGLSFPSESDAPLTPYRWAGPGEPTPEALLCAEGRPPETPVEIVDLAELFEGLTEPGDEASDAERAEAARWRALVELLEKHLRDLRVYRVGEVDVDAYILGRHRSGAWLGLKTHLVET